MDIGDLVKSCKVLLLDVEGTTSSISFVKDELFPYVEKNVKQYLETQWETDDVKTVLAALRQLALKDAKDQVEGLVKIPPEDASKEDQIEGLVNNVKWQMSCDRKTGVLKLLQGLVLKQGYECGEIKGHVYEDVLPLLKQWRSKKERKVYIYSSGSVQAQKLMFGQSVSGNLLVHIDGHFDTMVGGKQEASSYTAIAQKIGLKPEEIIFLTDIVQEAEAARSSGMMAALVLRDVSVDPASRCTCAPLPHPHIHSLADLYPTNKRKPETQEEELPSKVAKTSTEDDVKTNVVEPAEKKANDVPVSMETDDAEPANVGDGVDLKENGKEEKPASVEIVNIEDVTLSSEGLPVSDAEPIVEETVEVMEEDISKSDEKEFKKNGKCETIPEVENETETASEEASAGTKIVEIEEETEKESPNNTGEVTESSEPVVDEPDSADAEMAELHNVAEVLGKECTDLLSKVNDVTNLDNISVKMLTPVVEENISNENGDSNDIVDSILESEIELELKQKQDMDNKNAEEEAANKVKLDDKEEEKEVTKTDLVDKVNETLETGDKCIDETEVPEIKVVEPEPAEETVTKDNSEAEKTSSPEEQIKVEADKETDNKEKDEKIDPASEEKSEAKVEPQVNGKSNGDTVEVVNGVAGKDEELHARLSVENGSVKEVANGSGEKDVQGNGEEKAADLDVADIKVKTVTETHSETIDQPTEA